MSFSLSGAHVLVTGAGVTGPPVAKALLAAGAVVTVTDANAERLRSLAESLPGLRVAHNLVAPPPDTALVVTAPGWRPDAIPGDAGRYVKTILRPLEPIRD